MNVCPNILARTLRRFSILTTLVLTVALLPFAVGAPALAAVPQQGQAADPGGNNGTVKVQEVDFDDPPNNDPHVGCTFLLEWYGFDKGDDIISQVTFEMQSPTGSVGLSVDGPLEVFVGGDAASGAGTPTGLDGREEYTLSFDGPPHPQQGYHVKLTINTPGSKGSDKKYKVFWVEGCDPVQPPAPAIHVDKTVADSNDPGTTGSLGEILTYTFTVTNTGNVPLTTVTITDPKLGMSGVPCVTNLAVGATATCPTKTYVVTAADVANGSVHNTATASGTPPTGPPVTDDDDVTIPTPPAPGISVEKSVEDSNDAGSMASLGETLTYTFQVTNTGNVPLSNVTITDPKLGMSGVACVAHLAVGATATCPTKTYVVTAADVAHGSVDNVATATGTPPTGPDVSDQDPADIPTQVGADPAINLQKTVVDSNDPGTTGSLGETLTYSFVVTNTGNVPLTNVLLNDPKLGLSNVLCVTNLAVGASASCPPQTYVVTAADISHGSAVNTATATGTPPTGPDVSDPDDATIPTPALPGIRVVKSVEDSNDAGSMASLGETLTYTFQVTNTGNVPLSNVTITDAKLGMSGVACVANLAVGSTATCPTKTYVVTAADVAHGSVDNVATATGTPPSGPDVSDDDDADIPTKAPSPPSIFLAKEVADSNDADSVGSLGEVLTYTFHVTNTGSVPLTDVTISDPMFSLSNAPCVASLAAGATTNCPLLPAQTHTVTAADVAHGSVDNTATTSGTPPTGPPVSDDDDAIMPVPNGEDESDLAIEKTADVSVAAPGDVVTYTLRVTNTGDGDAHDVVVTDVIPSGATYVSSSSPCTFAGSTVTCDLGTIEAGDDREITIKVRVDALGNGDSSHSHHLDFTKVEAHIASFEGDTTTATADCPQGYIATDGSVRLDHVDQGAGTFEDVVVLASGVSPNGRSWTGTIRNDTAGQVQAKVNVVCMTDKTTSGENHSHPVVVTGPTSAPVTLGSGRHDIDLSCAPGSYPIRPSFVLTDGQAVVGTRRTAGGWRFIVDVDDTVEGTFSIHCLSDELGTANGHTHNLKFTELSDSVTVPAGQVVERKLTCPDHYKGIVAWADLDPGLVSLGNDPQPITRVFRFYNPTDGPLSARFGLLCVAIRTFGGNTGDSEVKNTASVSTSSPDASSGDNSDSATFTVTATGMAVAPKATVVTGAGKTSVAVELSSSGKRTASFKLLAAGKIKGTHLKAGSMLAHSKAKLQAGQATIRLVAKGAAGAALKKGKVTRAKLVITVGKHRIVRVVKLR